MRRFWHSRRPILMARLDSLTTYNASISSDVPRVERLLAVKNERYRQPPDRGLRGSALSLLLSPASQRSEARGLTRDGFCTTLNAHKCSCSAQVARRRSAS